MTPPVAVTAVDEPSSTMASKSSSTATATATAATAARATATATPLPLASDATHTLVLSTIRILIADLCQQFSGGHPGGAMGMAAIGIALYRYTLLYSPLNPHYPNRDRFVLSNGHTCLFQYVFHHLVGHPAMTMSQLKSYHSSRHDSICPGHPEIEHPGIEVTTGPLGQGIANAVGMAMAGKHLAARFNRDEEKKNKNKNKNKNKKKKKKKEGERFELVKSTIWCMTGDACLQEGVGLEAISLAGHWKLSNLVLIYDNNGITCDGSTDICNTEDVNAKMRACGWDVLDVQDGSYDVAALVAAMAEARAAVNGRPTFINVRTVIGVGSHVEGQAKAHGAAFGVGGVRKLKESVGVDPDSHFVVPEEVYAFFADLPARGRALESSYAELLARYRIAYPELAAEFERRISGSSSKKEEEEEDEDENEKEKEKEKEKKEVMVDWATLLPTKSALPTKPTATRVSVGALLQPLFASRPEFMVGTADLSPSVNMNYPGAIPFNPPSLSTVSPSLTTTTSDYSGRYIHYGIREHAMAAISNGLAAFLPGTIIPVTSSFFMFYLYAAPAVRMGALMRLQAIHIATHDSIGTGEDGPTHQPIELASLYRSMPNTLYIRPCDAEEAAGAVLAALTTTTGPTILSLSRQPLPQLFLEQQQQHQQHQQHQHSSPSSSDRNGVLKGGYILSEHPQAKLTLLSSGSELQFALSAASILTSEHNIPTRLVSIPCHRLFDAQTPEYRQHVLQRHSTGVVAVEAYDMAAWSKYADAGYGMGGGGGGGGGFGKSLPGGDAYRFFGFDPEVIAAAVRTWWVEVEEVGGGGIGGVVVAAGVRSVGWRELNATAARRGIHKH